MDICGFHSVDMLHKGQNGIPLHKNDVHMLTPFHKPCHSAKQEKNMGDFPFLAHKHTFVHFFWDMDHMHPGDRVQYNGGFHKIKQHHIFLRMTKTFGYIFEDGVVLSHNDMTLGRSLDMEDMGLDDKEVNMCDHRRAGEDAHKFHHKNVEPTKDDGEDPPFAHKSRNISEVHCRYHIPFGTLDMAR